MTAPRPANLAGASQFDRVIILATSRPPAANASMPPPAFGRPAVQQMMQPPPDDDDGEPGDQGPMPPPVMGPNGPIQQVFPGPAVGPNGQPLNGVPMPVPVGPNGVPLGPNAQPPTTSPRHGMIPAQPQQGYAQPAAYGADVPMNYQTPGTYGMGQVHHGLSEFSVGGVVALSIFVPLFPLIYYGLAHGNMPKRRPDDPSAGKAIGFYFIPIFSIYWMCFFTMS
jgi:hypothetical protein